MLYKKYQIPEFLFSTPTAKKCLFSLHPTWVIDSRQQAQQRVGEVHPQTEKLGAVCALNSRVQSPAPAWLPKVSRLTSALLYLHSQLRPQAGVGKTWMTPAIQGLPPSHPTGTSVFQVSLRVQSKQIILCKLSRRRKLIRTQKIKNKRKNKNKKPLKLKNKKYAPLL